ncbi:MAG: hydroxylamine reductase [Chloroflexi bacterium]|nr:hydroxylamine reductase [Chloroflexota bacterium]
MSMFCYQCQETARGQGCTVRGVCGKEEPVANLQDALIALLKGIAVYSLAAKGLPLEDLGVDVDRFIVEGLFTTITNVNFNAEAILSLVRRAFSMRQALRERLAKAQALPEHLPIEATFGPEEDTLEGWLAASQRVGLLQPPSLPAEERSLRHLILYGLKGMAAYADHAMVLGYRDEAILTFMKEALAAITDDTLSVEDLKGWVQRTGEVGVRTMALLDQANTATYGHPQPTEVYLGVKPGPGILVSGHDLRDLHELLEQTRGKGINIYTHGEMLPAHAYPALKKYEHLVGNYGGSWWRQGEEFEKFNGPILMTTNCLIPPKPSYIGRLFTTGVVSWPGVPHIADRVREAPKDFSPIIAKALECPSPQPLESGTVPIGYAHESVLSRAGQIIEAIKTGAVKRFVVMAGCDGRMRSREYYTEVAKALPPDSIILTAGCAKYRYNKLGLGTIGGLPRVLDAGQCNDSYSLVVIAMKLAEALGAESVNDLPIAYDIAWYEQKAVIVLLALLSLGIKRIRLGPTLPAFLAPGVVEALVQTFDLRPIQSVEEDVAAIVAGR